MIKDLCFINKALYITPKVLYTLLAVIDKIPRIDYVF
ncbi:hypothetical protein X975_15931, partial [Stegodyphus mimosarum]